MIVATIINCSMAYDSSYYHEYSATETFMKYLSEFYNLALHELPQLHTAIIRALFESYKTK